ncbi:TIGR04197 family type VII secretion effector [Virgibacillus sp. YIM 98842]|uniref:TIGR04197 family type VII secretion effector n=1 Tax=Virgibacillus sp. YIM 98842 TaxID=2663533 RepID=UPI0013DB6275|nr:TIGR04197 family type VII secretion effector [Virgibacillus sp. YIM 98842]
MIQSNLGNAEHIATLMGQASDAIERATQKSLNTADKTTLTVNERAQTANQQAVDLSQAFNQAFQQTIQNIQSAAEEFERTDSQLQQMFNSRLFYKNV